MYAKRRRLRAKLAMNYSLISDMYVFPYRSQLFSFAKNPWRLLLPMNAIAINFSRIGKKSKYNPNRYINSNIQYRSSR